MLDYILQYENRDRQPFWESLQTPEDTVIGDPLRGFNAVAFITPISETTQQVSTASPNFQVLSDSCGFAFYEPKHKSMEGVFWFATLIRLQSSWAKHKRRDPFVKR